MPPAWPRGGPRPWLPGRGWRRGCAGGAGAAAGGRAARSLSDGFHSRFQPMEAMKARLEELQRHNAGVELRTLASGAPLLVLRGSRGVNCRRPAAWLQGGMHACEWIGPATVMFLAEALLERSDLLSLMDVYLLPVFNVDGYRLSWEGERFRRNCPSGVNPNLNFPTAFGRFGPLVRLLYRPERPGSSLHHGPAPLSEPSCQEVAEELRGVEDLKVFIDFHSYGQKWGFPYVYTRQRAPDYARLKVGAELAADAAYRVHGVEYEAMQLGFLETGGGSIVDWVYEELHVPFSYTVELRPDLPQGLPLLWGILSKGLRGVYHEGFELPEREIVEVGEEMLAGVAALLAHAAPSKR